MREGTLLGVPVEAGCRATFDEGRSWDFAGETRIGEAWARVRVGEVRVTNYGYGHVSVDGYVEWCGTGYEEAGSPAKLMRALGFPHPGERDRALRGAALRSATARWERLVERMAEELVDLLPGRVEVPEPDEDEEEEAYA